MNSLLVKEYIDTVATLNQFVQRKRFQLSEGLDYSLDSPVAISINNEIKEQYELDLMSITSEDALLKYGEHLQEKLNSVIKNFYFNSSLNEELELLGVIKECPVEDYAKNDFDNILNSTAKDLYNHSIESRDNFVRDIIGSVGVTVPSFLFSIRHPEKVQLIDLRSGNYPVNGTKHYLVSSKIRIRNKEMFMLADIVEPYDKPSQLYARSCFFFEKSNKRIHSPVRMFLQGINEYGNEINLEGIKKHFFLQKKIDNVNGLVQDGLSYKNLGYRGKMSLFFTIARSNGDVFYQFSYMLLKDEIISDMKKGIFL